jgi:phage terminase large subunit
MFYYTSAIDRIRLLQKRKKIIQGGSSAGKTFAILAILIDLAARNKNTSISVVSESMPHLRRGAMRDFINIMKETNRFFEERFNKTESRYTFSTGSYIEFFSADEPSKLRGARRDILYINEANNIPWEAYQELAIRTRGDIYIDFNPTRTFWAHSELMNDLDTDFIILNYKDNEALDNNTIKEFEMAKIKAATSDFWANWVKVYVDGEIGSLEGTIYTNWTICNTIPQEAKLLGVGLDFGFTNDPTAAIEVWKLNDELILNEIIYQTGLTNPQITSLLKQHGITNAVEVWCDSAEPKSIAELKSMGIKAVGAVKGKDSVMFGISVIQQYKLNITSHSKNLIKELENYIWLKKNGETTNIPADAFNHACDAMRYLIMSKLGKKQSNNKTPFIISSR